MTLFGVNIEQRTTATAKTTAGPSTSLRSAQNDDVGLFFALFAEGSLVVSF
jgi:hypothetical protein